ARRIGCRVDPVDRLHGGRPTLEQEPRALAVAEERDLLVVDLHGGPQPDVDREAQATGALEADVDLLSTVADHVPGRALLQARVADVPQREEAPRERLPRQRRFVAP